MKTFGLFLVLFACMLLCSQESQSQNRYRYLLFDSTKIQIARRGDFSHFIFYSKREQTGSNYRILEAEAYDTTFEVIETFILSRYSHNPQFVPLANRREGVYIMGKELIKTLGMDGSFHCYLKPEFFRGRGVQRNYVTYKLEAFPALPTIAPKNNLKRAFKLNPSPPSGTFELQ